MNVLLNDLKKQGLTEEEAREYRVIDTVFRQGSEFKEDLQIVDYYYLQRELLENVKYTITDSETSITTDSTIYVQVKNKQFQSIQDILTLRKKVVNQAKNQGHKISYKKGYKKTLEQLQEQYNIECKQYINDYQVIKDRVAHIKENRGLHMGIVNDYYLKETQQIAWGMQDLLVGNSAISQVCNIENMLHRLLNSIEYAKINNERLTIYL